MIDDSSNARVGTVDGIKYRLVPLHPRGPDRRTGVATLADGEKVSVVLTGTYVASDGGSVRLDISGPLGSVFGPSASGPLGSVFGPSAAPKAKQYVPILANGRALTSAPLASLSRAAERRSGEDRRRK